MCLDEYITILKAFSDAKRLKILSVLSTGEHCACDLMEELETTQSGLSYQMKILTEAGLVTGRPSGKWVHYSINPQGVAEALSIIKMLTGIEEG